MIGNCRELANAGQIELTDGFISGRFAMILISRFVGLDGACRQCGPGVTSCSPVNTIHMLIHERVKRVRRLRAPGGTAMQSGRQSKHSQYTTTLDAGRNIFTPNFCKK